MLTHKKPLSAELQRLIRTASPGSQHALRTLYYRVAHQALRMLYRSIRYGITGKIAEQIDNRLSLIVSTLNQQGLEIQRSRWSESHAVQAAQPPQAAELYLDLLESILTGMLFNDAAQSPAGARPYDATRRALGRDWPATAETMIGRARMRNLRILLESAIHLGIPGDFIETGVWRGGSCIYAKAILKAHGDTERRVYVADSFRGLPPPNAAKYPADAGDVHSTLRELAISRGEVEENFRRYGMLDDRVVFIEGWFKDTLPHAPIDKLCVLRLDGDLYESTIVALDALYHKISPGGFVIVDDYLLPPCASAVHDFRSREAINAPLQPIDEAGVWWQVP
jgi:O-methyltransferase